MTDRANEPAYPALESISGNGESRYPAGGLTIREHFAGLAMQGIRAASNVHVGCDIVAEIAVKQADALIAALNQEQGK